MTNQEYNDTCWHTIRPKGELSATYAHPYGTKPEYSAERFYQNSYDLRLHRMALEQRRQRGYRNTVRLSEMISW